MRINYHRVVRQANEIGDLGDELKRVAQKLGDMINEIPDAWSGDASDAYIRQCDDLKGNMRQTARDITNIADLIRRVAKRIHDEDERQAREAHSLNK